MQNFSPKDGLSLRCFQLLEFQLARIHSNCSPAQSCADPTTPTHRSGLQLIPSVVWKPARTRFNQSDPLHAYFKRGPRGHSRVFAWFRIVSFLPSLHHGLFHESLESVKRCQPCLTRRSEPSRISWPRCRVSRVPRECSNRANSATLMSRIYLIYLSTRSRLVALELFALLLLSFHVCILWI